MAWIETVSLAEDTPAGRAMRAHLSDVNKGSKPSPIVTVFSILPDMLRARLEFVRAMTFGGSGLGRRNEELIATQVSGLLGCKF